MKKLWRFILGGIATALVGSASMLAQQTVPLPATALPGAVNTVPCYYNSQYGTPVFYPCPGMALPSGTTATTQPSTVNDTTIATSAAVFQAQSNVIIANVKQYGAIGNGSSHQACTTLGLANLTALQAYKSGIYSFATACTNEMDWLATQYAINKLTTTGGTVKMPGGTYVWDQTVILPISNNNTPTSYAMYLNGDGLGSTLVIPSVSDFGPGTAMISCGPPGALPSDNGGAGSGRYTVLGECFGGLNDITFYNPFVNGTTNVTSTSYARGIINVPAPSVSGGAPIQMDGVVVGARMDMHRVGSWYFRMNFNIVGDHMTWSELTAPQGLCGLYWAQESTFLQSDITLYGHNYINGNDLGGFCIDKDAELNVQNTGDLYIGFQPYGFIKFPGTQDAYLGDPSQYFPFMGGSNFQFIQGESIGNALIWDDNLTNTGGTVNSTEGGLISLSNIGGLFATWGSNRISAGGRNSYAWIGAGVIGDLTIKNPFSCCGAFEVGGTGQVAGIIDNYSGPEGLDITGDLNAGLASYSSIPLVLSELGSYCPATKLHDLGIWDGQLSLLDTTATSISLGQVMHSLGATIGIADGTKPIIGVSGQAIANNVSAGGSCAAIVTSGLAASVSVPTGATQSALLIATTGGNATTGVGGFMIGTASSSGISVGVNLNGIGSFEGTAMPASSAGYDLIYSNTQGTNLARAAGRTSSGDAVLTSTGAAFAQPVNYSCAALGNGTTQTCTWNTPLPTGYLSSCGVSSGTSGLTYTVSDSSSNSYTGYGATTLGTSAIKGYYFPNISAPITTVTVTASATASQLTLQCNGAANVATSSPADGSCTGTTSSATSLSCGTAITTTTNGDYIMCMGLAFSGGATLAPTLTNFTLGSSNTAYVANQYEVQTSAGSITPGYSFGTTAPGFMFCGAFKPGATLSAGPPVLKNAPLLALSLYTVSSGTGNPALPSATSLPIGTQVGITDCTTFTPGTLCTGGGSDFMIGVTNGTVWTVH